MTTHFYLIVEPVSIIADDLALSVKDFDQGAIVVVAGTQQEALAAITDCGAVRFAFVHADPKGFDETVLGQALTERRAVCVFMGDAADLAKKALIVLDRPFSPQTIAALLARLTAETFV